MTSLLALRVIAPLGISETWTGVDNLQYRIAKSRVEYN